MTDITIVKHASTAWIGAYHLHMADTGHLLAVGRGDPLRTAAERLIQENYSPSSVLTIRCAGSLVPDVTGTIESVLASR
jgi:hypothetical protein